MKTELREFVASPHFPTAFLAVIAILAVLALVIGWKIYPYTIGGVERFTKSPIQHFFARCSTAFVVPIFIACFGYKGFIGLTATPADKVRAIEEAQQEIREQVKTADDPFDGKPASPSREQVARMRDLEAQKQQELKKLEAQLDEPTALIPSPKEEGATAVSNNAVVEPKSTMHSDQAEKKSPPAATPSPFETAVSPSNTKVAELKGELAKVNSQIESERARWTEALNTINQLTNFKKTPVKEGSAAYHRCMAASKVIHEVETGAPALKSEKARLEAVIKELEE